MALLLVGALAGCSFRVHGLPSAPVDGGVGGPGDDPGATGPGAPDFGPGADLADVCQPLAAPLAGALAASCTVGQPPTIDGDLSDWPAALFVNQVRHQTAALATGTWDPNEAVDDATASAVFAVRWDQQALYLAFRVTDDRRGVDSNQGLWEDDSLELYFDGPNDQAKAYGPGDFDLVFTADGRGVDARSGQALPATLLHAAKDDGGAQSWTLELAVPWSLLTGVATTGRVLGFDVQVDDNDDDLQGGQVRDRALVWRLQPRPADCATASTSCQVCALYCDPRLMTPLQLGGR